MVRTKGVSGLPKCSSGKAKLFNLRCWLMHSQFYRLLRLWHRVLPRISWHQNLVGHQRNQGLSGQVPRGAGLWAFRLLVRIITQLHETPTWSDKTLLTRGDREICILKEKGAVDTRIFHRDTHATLPLTFRPTSGPKFCPEARKMCSCFPKLEIIKFWLVFKVQNYEKLWTAISTWWPIK